MLIASIGYFNRSIEKGEQILLIGGGPSGLDLAAQLSQTAERITFSQHKIPNETKEAHANREKLMPPRTILQDNVKRFTPNGAEFLDGTHQTFSVVIFATGIAREEKCVLFQFRI